MNRKKKPKKIKAPPLKDSTRFKSHLPPDLKSYNSNKPMFSFYFMAYGSKKCMSKCENKSKSSISDTLLRLSQFTWEQIISQPKRGLGYEIIPQGQFKHPLPKEITPDVSMYIFRFSEEGRMAGFRDKDIYHVVQVGESHDLY